MDTHHMIEAFTLSLPHAPEMIRLDPASPDAHGGASIKDTESKPFQVVMLPYLDQNPLDVIALYLNDEFIDDQTVVDEQSTTTVFIPPGMFQKGQNRLKFRVTRTSGNHSDTKDLMLLHRTSPPGDTPPVLSLSVSHTSIGPDQADNVSVTVSYKNAQWYDRIFVDCNGARLQHQLVPDSPSPLPPAPKSVVIPIPRAMLEQGGDDSDFEFKFRVVDYLNNPSGPPTWSDSVYVDVHLDRLSLPMAVLREIPTDNSDDPSIVDLEKMKGGPLWALVHLSETVWKIGDSIHLSFNAERQGTVVGTHDQTLPVTQVPTQQAWEIPNAKVLADSTVTVVYQLIRDGDVIATSNPAVATAEGIGNVELLPPKLVKPAVSPIDVLAYPNGVTMRIEYLCALDGDRARLVEINAPAGTPQFPLVVFNSNKRVNVVLSAAFLAARHGREIEFRWNLNRKGGQAGRSPPMGFHISAIVPGDDRLPVAILRENPTDIGDHPGTIDLEKINGGPLWALIQLVESVWKAGDSIHLKFSAKIKETLVAEFEQIVSISQIGTQLTWEIPNRNVIAGSQVHMVYSVYREQIAIASSKPAIADVTTLRKAVCENFETILSHDFHANQPIRLDSGITLTGVTSYIADSAITARGASSAIYIFPNAILEIKFDRRVTDIKIEYSATYGAALIKFFKSDNTTEDRHLISGPDRKTFSYSSDVPFTRFHISCSHPENAAGGGLYGYKMEWHELL